MTTQTKPKRKAWCGTNSDGYPSEIVWADTRGQAKSLLAGQLEIDFTEVEYVRRFPALDDFDGDLIEYLLDAGWFWECTQCNRHTGKEYEGFVRDGESMFCSAKCKERHDAYWAKVKADEVTCREEFERMHPGVPIEHLWCNQFGWWVSAGEPLNRHVTVREFPRERSPS
jgi:hypothetical protein